MKYPTLKNTPIKETVFSISYDAGFEKFVELKEIQERFPVRNTSMSLKISAGKTPEIFHQKNGYHLKNENEVVHLRKGSLSYHYLNKYNDFETMVSGALKFWNIFIKIIDIKLTINSVSVRYINEIDIDDENQESRIVQIYPKHSSDREIENFQHFVSFRYNNQKDCLVNIASTKPAQDKVLLDITVQNERKKDTENTIEELFNPLRDIKNRAFFDSITAQALVRYIN